MHKGLVTRQIRDWTLLPLLFAALSGAAQEPMQSLARGGGSVERGGGTATALYRELRDVGLDPAKVYKIREASIDREDLHITFEDGTIGFMQAVDGRVTGAFFSGSGEVLIRPPDRVERTSMQLFTGAAILEENFSGLFLRFNDATADELKPYLRPTDDAPQFITDWNGTVHTLAEADALRLVSSFLNTAPVKEGFAPGSDRMLRARVQGDHLGVFDIFFDTDTPEPISVGALAIKNSGAYFDLWTSFKTASMRKSGAELPLPIQIEGYRVRAEVQPPARLSATTEVRLKAATSGQRIMFFELSRFLKVSSVQWEGKELEILQNEALEGTALARRGNDLVGVVFPEAVAAGTRLTLTFTYSGEVLGDAGGGLLYVGARGDWYPARGMQIAQFDLEFRYPQEWTLVATGKLDSERSEGTDKISHWISERPLPLAGFNLGRYQRSQAQAANVEVDVYAAKGVETAFVRPKEVVAPSLPAATPYGEQPSRRGPPPTIYVKPLEPDPQKNAEQLAAKCARGVQAYSAMFGPYPYSRLALTQNPGQVSQGWPGLVFLSSYAFLSSQERTASHLTPFENLLFSDFMQLHETAHQWWGDLVAWHTYRDQWLVEALANYSALLVLEQDRPADVHQVLEHYRQQLAAKNEDGEATADAGPVTLGLRLSNSHFPKGFEAVSYGRGTWLLHMLRMMMRDSAEGSRRNPRLKTVAAAPEEEPFLRGLRKLRERFAGRQMTTEDFVAAMTEELPEGARYEGKKSLDWFVDGWINGNSMPTLSLGEVKYTVSARGRTASGSIVQKNAPPDLVTSAPLYAVTASKTVYVGRVFADAPETSFRITVPADTRKLLLDPYGTVLTKP